MVVDKEALGYSQHCIFIVDDWLKCDDDNVTPQTTEDILKLSGGGDWHIAYLLLYGPRRLEKRKDDDTTKIQSMETVPMETDGAKQS